MGGGAGRQDIINEQHVTAFDEAGRAGPDGEGAAEIAKVLFFIFLVLFVISLVAGLFRRGP